MGGIRFETDGGLGIITLDDPEGGNRLNQESVGSLLEAVARLVTDASVRAVMIRASGSSFCLGMDLVSLGAAEPSARPAGIEHAVSGYVRLLEAIHAAPKPFIAAVDGAVKAGGVGLVSSCDVVVASDRASFELGEAFFGIIPANVLPFLLTLRVPLQKARYLILTGRALSAHDALSIGLVDELYPADGLERGLRDLLKRVWRTSPVAAAETKSFTRELLELAPEEARRRARNKLQELLAREETIRAIASFNEGGTPPWFGKFRPSRPLLAEGDRPERGGGS